MEVNVSNNASELEAIRKIIRNIRGFNKVHSEEMTLKLSHEALTGMNISDGEECIFQGERIVSIVKR